MKRILAVMLIAVMASLAGCGQPEDEAQAPEAPDAQIEAPGEPQAEAEPAAKSDPTPMPAVELKDYQYEVVDNQALGVSFKYPSHWINSKPNEKRIRFEEPVPPGEFPASVSVTMKDPGKIVVTEPVGMDQLSAFSKQLKKRYQNYKMKRGKRFKISKNTAFCFTYTGETPSGVKIKGYAALVYIPKKNKFYLLHFNCKAEQYQNFSNIRNTIIKSVRA